MEKIKHPEPKAQIYSLYGMRGTPQLIASGRYMFVWDALRKRYWDKRFNISLHKDVGDMWYVDAYKVKLGCPDEFVSPQAAIEYLVINYCPLAIGTYGIEE